MKKLFSILITLILVFSFNYKKLSAQEKNETFSNLLYEYRHSKIKVYDEGKDITDKFLEILKLEDDIIIKKIQESFKSLTVEKLEIENRIMFRSVPSTLNKTLTRDTFHSYKIGNDIFTWYSKIKTNFDVNVNSGTIYSINNRNISFHKIYNDKFSNLVLSPSIKNSYYKMLGGGGSMLISYSYSMELKDNNGNPKFFPGNFNDMVTFYAH